MDDDERKKKLQAGRERVRMLMCIINVLSSFLMSSFKCVLRLSTTRKLNVEVKLNLASICTSCTTSEPIV